MQILRYIQKCFKQKIQEQNQDDYVELKEISQFTNMAQTIPQNSFHSNSNSNSHRKNGLISNQKQIDIQSKQDEQPTLITIKLISDQQNQSAQFEKQKSRVSNSSISEKQLPTKSSAKTSLQQQIYEEKTDLNNSAAYNFNNSEINKKQDQTIDNISVIRPSQPSPLMIDSLQELSLIQQQQYFKSIYSTDNSNFININESTNILTQSTINAETNENQFVKKACLQKQNSQNNLRQQEQQNHQQLKRLRSNSFGSSNRIQMYKKSDSLLFFDCEDEFEFDYDQKDPVQNTELLQNPSIYLQWQNKLNKLPFMINLNQKMQENFLKIKLDFLKSYIEKIQNEENILYDKILEEPEKINIYFRSEINFQEQRIIFIKCDFYVNCIDWGQLINFINSLSVQKKLYGFQQVYKLNEGDQDTILYSQIYNQQLDKNFDFITMKHFQSIGGKQEIEKQRISCISRNLCDQIQELSSEEEDDKLSQFKYNLKQNFFEIDLSVQGSEFEEIIQNIQKQNFIRGNLLKVINYQLYECQDKVVLTKLQFFMEIKYQISISTTEARNILYDQYKQQILKFYQALTDKYPKNV